LDKTIDYVVEVYAARPIPASAFHASLSRFKFIGKPAWWIGRLEDGQWTDAGAASGESFTELKAALQLANRAGPISEAELKSFCGMIRNVAAELQLEARFPPESAALEAAAKLDQFVADVDVLIGINVVTDSAPMPGAKIRALAESEGMKLAADGSFQLNNAEGDILFSLSNQEPRAFNQERTEEPATSGVTFLLDVPRVKDGLKVFDRIVAVARRFAAGLGGMLVDDKRAALSEPQVRRIRAQVKEIYELMEARGIPAGGPIARRLFSE
jgi:hypothetical protein